MGKRGRVKGGENRGGLRLGNKGWEKGRKG